MFIYEPSDIYTTHTRVWGPPSGAPVPRLARMAGGHLVLVQRERLGRTMATGLTYPDGEPELRATRYMTETVVAQVYLLPMEEIPEDPNLKADWDRREASRWEENERRWQEAEKAASHLLER